MKNSRKLSSSFIFFLCIVIYFFSPDKKKKKDKIKREPQMKYMREIRKKRGWENVKSLGLLLSIRVRKKFCYSTAVFYIKIYILYLMKSFVWDRDKVERDNPQSHDRIRVYTTFMYVWQMDQYIPQNLQYTNVHFECRVYLRIELIFASRFSP